MTRTQPCPFFPSVTTTPNFRGNNEGEFFPSDVVSVALFAASFGDGFAGLLQSSWSSSSLESRKEDEEEEDDSSLADDGVVPIADDSSSSIVSFFSIAALSTVLSTISVINSFLRLTPMLGSSNSRANFSNSSSNLALLSSLAAAQAVARSFYLS
ncbi:hypothetical protein ACA910_001118 [Epithemia clementina (nom. ined.)]